MRNLLLLTTLLFGIKIVTAQRAISSEEALATAHRIEDVTNSGDPSALNHFFDVDSLIKNIQRKSDALKDPAFMSGFSGSFSKSFANYGQQMMASIQMGNYRLLREYESEGSRRLLFRMFGSGGLNYHEYRLVRVRDSIKASDVFVYTLDETLSSNLASLVDMMSNSGDHLTEEVATMKAMREQFNKKNYAGVKEQYDKLDEKYKRNKAILMLYISACHQLDLPLYQNAIEHFAASFPDAPSAYLMMIDVYYLRKEYDKGLEAIDKMDKLIGGDKMLDLYRGNFYKLQGKKAESIVCYEKVYRYDPTLAANVQFLVTGYEETGEKARAKTVFTDFKKTKAFHDADFSDLLSKYPDLK